MRELGSIEWEDIADLRNKCIEIFNRYGVASGETAAALASGFYEAVRAYSYAENYKARVFYDAATRKVANEEMIRACVQKVVDGKSADVLFKDLVARADYEIKRAAGDCVYKNGERDKRDVKFARVPTGEETCEFCLMLASRGAVYHTAASAGKNAHYHANCDCRIVPVFEGQKVEGYDPQALYEEWKKIEQKKKEKQNNNDDLTA